MLLTFRQVDKQQWDFSHTKAAPFARLNVRTASVKATRTLCREERGSMRCFYMVRTGTKMAGLRVSTARMDAWGLSKADQRTVVGVYKALHAFPDCQKRVGKTFGLFPPLRFHYNAQGRRKASTVDE